LITSIRAAGFEDVEVVKVHDIYASVPDPSSALDFGTKGISFRARKPG
jgi:hypothetical protein